MDLRENNLINSDMEKVIATFDFSEGQEEIKKENCIGEMMQSEFSFTDGFEENIANDNIEEIEMLKEEESITAKVLNIKENEERLQDDTFKDYLKICYEMELIPSWRDFEKYNGFQKKNF